MTNHDFCKTEIEFMNLKQLKEFLLSVDCKNIVLVVSERAQKRYGLEDVIEQMQKKFRLLWIKENVSYPTQKTLLMGCRKMKEFDAEVIIAVGGGSSIDFAKGLKAFYHQEISSTAEITELLLKKKGLLKDEGLSIIAVPTTAGTGAEVTKWATIWDEGGQCKYSIDMDQLKPDKALIVPELTVGADLELTVSTGLDALSHAMEAYWSRKTSPLVRQLSRQAVSLILENLGRIVEEPDNLIYREKQCIASVLSGLSFSVTRTTACHSISYPLTMQFQIPHGIAAAMTLAQVAERNRGSFPEDKELFDLFQPFGGIWNYIESLLQGNAGIRLRDYGIKEKDLSGIAEHSFTLGRMDNNPVTITREDVVRILSEVY